MLPLARVVAALCAGATVAGCAALLGVEDPVDGMSGAGGGTATTTTVGSTSHAGSTSSTGAQGGAGGEEPAWVVPEGACDLVDAFDAAQLDLNRWNQWGDVGLDEGRLRVTTGSNADAGVVAVEPSFTHDCSITFELGIDGALGSGTPNRGFIVRSELGSSEPGVAFALLAWDGTWSLRVSADEAAGTTTLFNQPHDEAAHRFLRMRRDGDQVVFEASPDGWQFTELGRATPSFAIEESRVIIIAWAHELGEGNDSIDFYVSNVNLVPPNP